MRLRGASLSRSPLTFTGNQAKARFQSVDAVPALPSSDRRITSSLFSPNIFKTCYRGFLTPPVDGSGEASLYEPYTFAAPVVSGDRTYPRAFDCALNAVDKFIPDILSRFHLLHSGQPNARLVGKLFLGPAQHNAGTTSLCR